MNYGLFFSEEDSKDVTALRIPVNPEKYGFSHPGDNTTYNIISLGEVVQPRIPRLFELSWDGIFPGNRDYPGVTTRGQFELPKFYIDAFLRYQSSRLPIWFTAVRTLESGAPIFDTKTQVVVDDFSYEERGGETGDFYYSIKLREYRSYLPQIVDVVEIIDGETPTAAIAVEPQREIPRSQLYVNCKVIINGRFHNDSYGGKPFGTASSRRGLVSRIETTDPNRAFPVHVNSESGGALGWVKADQLQVIT